MKIYKEDIGFNGTKDDLQSELNQYKKDKEYWEKSEGIPKPIPRHMVYDELLDGEEYTLVSKKDEQEAAIVAEQQRQEQLRLDSQKQQKEEQEKRRIDNENKCNPEHSSYDWAYARQNGTNGYKETEEQLDLLYHDIEAGKFGDGAKTSKLFSLIKQVKDTYPKQNSDTG